MKYLLDTNVLSEMVKSKPNSGVLRRFQEHQWEIALAAPGWQESLFGLLTCPDPRRVEHLERFFSVVEHALPILPYNAEAARWHAQQRASRKARTPSWEADAWIAAVAAVHGLIVVTRNRKDFDFPGLPQEDWFD